MFFLVIFQNYRNLNTKTYIPKLYKRQANDLLFFGFVNGVLASLPSMSLKDCILLYQERFGMTEDDMPLDSVRITYYRMQKEMEELM
jgi:hypothetical protein